MQKLIILLIIVLTISCNSSKKQTNTFKVAYYGALKNMMHKGDISAKVNLADFKDTKHLYALGAFENLKGEIQIFDSKASNTKVIDNTLAFDDLFNKQATLFVYATVKKWKDITIPESILTYEQLEKYIAKTAKENNINTNEPFPFLIDGKATSFDWHVINWKYGDKEHSHKKHINSGLHGTIKDRTVNMLGFYSNAHHAIFTHHTTNMHIHVKTTDTKIAGHVDGLILGKGMVLRLPETN